MKMPVLHTFRGLAKLPVAYRHTPDDANIAKEMQNPKSRRYNPTIYINVAGEKPPRLSRGQISVGALFETVNFDITVGLQLHNGIGVMLGGSLLDHTLQGDVVDTSLVAIMACVVMPLKYGSHLRVTLQHLAYGIGIIDTYILVYLRETSAQLM